MPGTFLILIKHSNTKLYLDSKIEFNPILVLSRVWSVFSKCEVLCWVMANIWLKRLIARLNLIYIIYPYWMYKTL